jgi:hypothetical protein
MLEEGTLHMKFIVVPVVALLFPLCLIAQSFPSPTPSPIPPVGAFSTQEECNTKINSLKEETTVWKGLNYGCPVNSDRSKDKVWFPSSVSSVDYVCEQAKNGKWVAYASAITNTALKYYTYNSARYGCMNSNYMTNVEAKSYTFCPDTGKVVLDAHFVVKGGSIEYKDQRSPDNSVSHVQTTMTPYKVSGTYYLSPCKNSSSRQLVPRAKGVVIAGSCLPEDLARYGNGRSSKPNSAVPECIAQSSISGYLDVRTID